MRKYLLIAAALVAVAMATPSQADAAFKIRVSDGGPTSVVTDNVLLDSLGNPGDTNPTTGFILYSTTSGGFTVIVTTGTSKPQPPNSSSTAYEDIGILAIWNGTGSNTLTIDLTDTGFALTPIQSAVMLSHAGNSSSNVLISETFQSYVNFGAGGNNEFGGIDATGGTVFTTGLQGPVAGGSSNDATGVVAGLTNPFSMSSRTVLTFSAPGTASIDNNTTLSTPAPAALVLLFSGAPVLAGYVVRRRRLANAA